MLTRLLSRAQSRPGCRRRPTATPRLALVIVAFIVVAAALQGCAPRGANETESEASRVEPVPLYDVVAWDTSEAISRVSLLWALTVSKGTAESDLPLGDSAESYIQGRASSDEGAALWWTANAMPQYEAATVDELALQRTDGTIEVRVIEADPEDPDKITRVARVRVAKQVTVESDDSWSTDYIIESISEEPIAP